MVMMMSMVLQMVVMMMAMGYILHRFLLHFDKRFNNGIAKVYSIFNSSFTMFKTVEDEVCEQKARYLGLVTPKGLVGENPDGLLHQSVRSHTTDEFVSQEASLRMRHSFKLTQY